MAYGHRNAFEYTFTQAAAFAEIGQKRICQELASSFVVTQHAMHADKEKAKKFLKELVRG